MHIPGGNRLIFSRKINLIGPNIERDIEGALRGRFPDLAQDNFDTGLVHLSYCLTEPVADPGWEIRLVIPVVEDDITPGSSSKLSFQLTKDLEQSMFHLSSTKTPSTGLDIVCGPQGELCACCHNGFQLGFAQLEVADTWFVFWEGRVCFTWFYLVCKFPWMFCVARALACVWVLLVLLVLWGWLLVSFFGEIWSQSKVHSSCWPTMSRTCPAMQEKKKRGSGPWFHQLLAGWRGYIAWCFWSEGYGMWW